MAVATKEEYRFFGEFEKHPKGGYRSEMPAWCFPNQLRDLHEELKAKEEALAVPGIAKARPELAQQAHELKLRIAQIEDSRPKLTPKQKDEIDACRKEIIETLQSTSETYSDSMRGLANPRAILKRQESYFVPVNKDIADACGIRTIKGKATGQGATMIMKIISHALGEESSSHQLFKPER